MSMFDAEFGLAVAEPDDMAKKRSAGEKSRPKQEIILVYKADSQTAEAFKAWLNELAEHVGAPITVTLDMALKHFAERQKFRAMPKRLAR